MDEYYLVGIALLVVIFLIVNRRIIGSALKRALEDWHNQPNTVLDLQAKIIALKKEKRVAEGELEDLKLTKKMEMRETEQLVKMKEEKLGIDYEKKAASLERTFAQKEMDLQTKYHGKVLDLIDADKKDRKDMYEKILARLPDTNLAIKLGSGRDREEEKSEKKK